MSGYNLQPFDGKSEFSIWKQKMKGILIQQKVYKAISGVYTTDDTAAIKAELNDMAHSAIILNLSEGVLRKVGVIDSAKDLWKKLEDLYTETSLQSKLYLLEKIFKFRLDMSKDINDNLDVFTKLILDIKLTGDKHIDDYSPIVLLNAIPDSYSDLKSAIKYGRDTISLDIVVNGLKSKELDLKAHKNHKGEIMHVRGRSHNRNRGSQPKSDGASTSQQQRRSKSRPRSKSKPKFRPRKCYNCGEPGHFIKDCTKPRKAQNSQANVASEPKDDLFLTVLNDYPSVNSVFENGLNESEWLVDSGCTYHMTSLKGLFSNYEIVHSGTVSMAN